MVPVDTAPVIVNEITLVGSRCGRFEPALHLLEHGLINVEDMISERLRLSQATEAVELAAAKGRMNVLIRSRERGMRMIFAVLTALTWLGDDDEDLFAEVSHRMIVPRVDT